MERRFRSRSRLRFRFRWLVPTLLILLCLAQSPPILAAIHPGKWTAWKRWGSESDPFSHAVHLILMPGDGNPYHSRILWWREEKERGGTTTFYGGQWGWKQVSDYNCVAYPDASFTDLGTAPLTGMDPFCSGHALLDSSYVLITGGTDPNTNQYGENKARIFRPGSGTSFGTWSIVEPMADWRWYPTTIPLRNARSLTLSGQGYPHHRVFGGKQNGTLPGSPTGDQVYRFVPVTGGSWDSPVIPDPDGTDRPEIRRSHTFVETFVEPGFEKAQTLFGGRGANGLPLNDTWLLKRDDNVIGADYRYSWHRRAASTAPPRRSDHSAVVGLSSMISYGGRDLNGNPLGDARRLRDVPPNGLQWAEVDTAGSLAGFPSPRFGHRAVYDVTGLLKRMIVFGGTSGDGQAATDLGVYELQLNATGSAGIWKKMTQVNLGSTPPGARFDHSMTFDGETRTHTYQSTTRQGHVAFVYGGQINSTTYSDSLWALWIFNDGTVGWELRSYGSPGPRARHSVTWDPTQPRAPTVEDKNTGRLYLTGGENASGQADVHLYKFDPWTSPSWQQWAGPGVKFSGHTMVREYDGTTPRIAERFNAPGSCRCCPWRTFCNSLIRRPSSSRGPPATSAACSRSTRTGARATSTCQRRAPREAGPFIERSTSRRRPAWSIGPARS